MVRVCEPRPAADAADKTGRAVSRNASGQDLRPAGQVVPVGQNPLHLAWSPQRGLLAVAEFGPNARGVSLLDVSAGAPRFLGRVGDAIAPPKAAAERFGYFRGLAFSPDGATLYAANAAGGRIDVIPTAGPPFAIARSLEVPATFRFVADLALSDDGATLFATAAQSRHLFAMDVATGAVTAQIGTGGLFPHALLRDGNRFYVAIEGAEQGRPNRVNVFDASGSAFTQVASYVVGKNPTALALSPDRRTLYVAASDDDWIDRIDVDRGIVLQPLPLQRFAPAAPGPFQLHVSPNALALSPDGRTLYVSSALQNAILVLDARSGKHRGAIPTDHRPSAVLLAGGGATLWVANGRGDATGPLPKGVDGSDAGRGTVQRLAPVPSEAALEALTLEAVAASTRPAREFEPPDPACDRVGPLPARRGQSADASLIKHVIVVLKENKTFDAVFGDFAGAAADPALTMFGAEITPNQHELARQFCLLDNFYAESEQSVEGHYWMTAQVLNDYFERVWPVSWTGRSRDSILPPGGIGALDSPRSGFIWDQLARSGVPYTSYGEFVGISGDLLPNIDTAFVDNPLNYLVRPDTEKLQVFLGALAAGRLDPFTFVALQWDHTYGVQPGRPTPAYMVADNDRATGLLVEAVSRSPFWKDTLILITEDDPAGGADHVDSHRSFALVVGPFAKRGHISHVRASFPSIAATWERALNVPPLSIHDAQAEPLWDCLTSTPDDTPFTALASNVAPAVSRRGDPGSEESLYLDFSTIDRAPGLGVALWKSMRPGQPVPARVREAAEHELAEFGTPEEEAELAAEREAGLSLRRRPPDAARRR